MFRKKSSFNIACKGASLLPCGGGILSIIAVNICSIPIPVLALAGTISSFSQCFSSALTDQFQSSRFSPASASYVLFEFLDPCFLTGGAFWSLVF